MQRYAALPDPARVADGYHYSAEAQRIFPRYHVVAAMLVQVERLDPDALPAVPDLVEILNEAADTAQSSLTPPASPAEQAEAAAEERSLFPSLTRGMAEVGDTAIALERR